MLRRRIVVAATTLALAVVILFLIDFSSSFVKRCLAGDHYPDNYAKCAYYYYYSIPNRLIAAGIHLFRSFGPETWTAIATGVIAAFTITLWLATHRLWIAHRETHEATQRAFIFIDGFNFELTTAADARIADTQKLPELYISQPGLYITRFAVQPRWKNSGNTPTKTMLIRTNWRGTPGPIPPEYVYRIDPIPFFVGPHAIECSEFVDITGTQELIEYAFNPLGAEPLIFFWGRADYSDVFGNDHFIEWCYRLRYDDHKGEGLRPSFIQWGEYNRTDEDNKRNGR